MKNSKEFCGYPIVYSSIYDTFVCNSNTYKYLCNMTGTGFKFENLELKIDNSLDNWVILLLYKGNVACIISE